LEELVIDGNVILKWILKDMGWEGVDYINLAQNSGGGLLWTVMILGVL
jgi:hypothetical protein